MSNHSIIVEMNHSQAHLRVIIAKSLELQSKLRAVSAPVFPEE